MVLYAYKAMNGEGRLLRGRLQAANLADLENRLSRLGLDLVEGDLRSSGSRLFSRRIPRRELIHFCFHLEMLGRAGIPILEALADIRDSADHPQLRATAAALILAIEGGQPLSYAMSEHPDIFPAIMPNLVRAGEQAGRLQEVLQELAENLKWEDELLAQARRLFLYPAIVSVLVLAAVGVAMIVVVPQLSRLFAEAGQVLPLHTRALIAVSHFAAHYWQAVLGTLLLAIFGLHLGIRRYPDWHYRFDRLKLALPLLGPILHKLILCRFTSLFRLMYASGIPLLEAVRLGEHTVGNQAIRTSLQQAGTLIADGHSLSEAFSRTELFPPLMIRMLRIGEQAGQLEQTLSNTAYFLDRDVKESSQKLQGMMEPGITLVLGGLMLWIMLAVLGPIYDIISRLKV